VRAEVYGLAGLRIISDFQLRGLQSPPEKDAAEGEVVIRRAPIPDELTLAPAAFQDGLHFHVYNEEEVLLEFQAAGRFLVRSGKEIVVDPAPASDAGEVHAHLLGTALGVLCHQRGIIPLHASAIDTAEGFVAFTGMSGSGKSTLAAALVRRGYQIVADDVCFLRRYGENQINAWPGIARIRLWAEAIQALSCDGSDVERELHGYNKYFIPVHQPQNLFRPSRLRRVYDLHVASDDVTIQITRLQGVTAVEALLQNIYRPGLAEQLGYKPQAFVTCAAAARNAAVFRLIRPNGFHALDKTINFLEAHLA